MKHSYPSQSIIGYRSQKGAALGVSLILLLVITLLSLTAMQNANLDTKIAVNHQHKQVTFQAAENALAILTGPGPGDSDSTGKAPRVPYTNPGNVEENPTYYVARGLDNQPDSTADLRLEFIEQSLPGQYKFSGYSLNLIAIIYDADAIGRLDNGNTRTHNRMQVALVR